LEKQESSSSVITQINDDENFVSPRFEMSIPIKPSPFTDTSLKNRWQDTPDTFSHMIDLDCDTSEIKWVTGPYSTMVAVPSNNKIHQTGKAGFESTNISYLGP
jgi:hypothetical protein